MAIGRINIRVGKKGKGLAHANYILRNDKYALRHDKFEKMEHTDFGNMPYWARENPKFFWAMADEHERKNGSVYREHILSLPRELNENQRLALVQDWIKSEIGDKHPYQFAIHNPKALDGKDQPHCHLMICERTLDGIDRGADLFFKRYNPKKPHNGGAKKANTGLDPKTRKEQILALRERWETTVNRHLTLANSKERISTKNYLERGLTEKPLNIPMTEFNKPQVKQAYQDQLTAKNELKQAQNELKNTLTASPMAESAAADTITQYYRNKQNQNNKQIKIHSLLTHTFETPKISQNPPFLPKNENLTTTQNQNTHENAPKPPKFARKNKNGTNIPPKQKGTLKTQNRAISKNPILSPEQHRQTLAFLREFNERIQKIAKQIWQNQLKALQNKGKPLLATFEKIRDSKPLFFGKDQWRKDKQQALDAYNAIKEQHDTIKAKGVTAEHEQQANEQLAKDDPKYYQKAKIAFLEIALHDKTIKQQEQEQERQQQEQGQEQSQSQETAKEQSHDTGKGR